MLLIKKGQIEEMKKKNLEIFCKDVLEVLQLTYSELYNKNADEHWKIWIHQRVAEAIEYEIVSEDETEDYVELCFLYQSIHEIKKPEWFLELMKQTAYTGADKIKILEQKLISED